MKMDQRANQGNNFYDIYSIEIIKLKGKWAGHIGKREDNR